MEPIINPFVIYFIELLDSINSFLVFLTFLSGSGSVGSFLYYFYLKNATDEYVNFDIEQTVIQNKMKENAYSLNNFFNRELDRLKVSLSDKDDTEQFNLLQETAQRCCDTLQDVRNRMDTLHKKFDNYVYTLKKCKTCIKICFPLTMFFILLDIMIPNTETAYKLLIVSNLTVDHFGIAKDLTKDVVEFTIDTIVNAIQKLR